MATLYQIIFQHLIAADMEIPDVFRHRGETPLAVAIKPLGDFCDPTNFGEGTYSREEISKT